VPSGTGNATATYNAPSEAGTNTACAQLRVGNLSATACQPVTIMEPPPPPRFMKMNWAAWQQSGL
jgi:hypothetical protein